MITKEQLQKIYPFAKARIDIFLQFLNKYADIYQVNTKLRLAAFLAQIGHESSQLTRIEENLNYSAVRLMEVFKGKFSSIEEASKYAYKPQAIANRVYAGKLGNGPESSGDGWKFRGRGIIQITLSDNYREITKDLGIDFFNNPDLLLQPEYAVKSAFWFWDKRKLNILADNALNFRTLTSKINTACDGYEKRLILYNTALKVLT